MFLMTTSLLINVASGALVAALLGFGMAQIAKLGSRSPVASLTTLESPRTARGAFSPPPRFERRGQATHA
jgi:hypothetical protein